VHALPAGRSRGWDLAELSAQLTSRELGTRMLSIRSQQAKSAKRQAPGAKSLRALTSFRVAISGTAPLTSLHLHMHSPPAVYHPLNVCNCYNIWLAITLHLMLTSHRHHRYHHRRHPSSSPSSSSSSSTSFSHSVPFSSFFLLFSHFLSFFPISSTTRRHYQYPCH
jgi:hypothetical protein